MKQSRRAVGKPNKPPPTPKEPSSSRTRRNKLLPFLLLIAILAVYGQVRDYGFVNFDDPDYVADNAHVRAGLTSESLAWAFTSGFGANWFPLTWLSHMLDCQVFGLRSGWHHLNNVLLHALSALLLFAVLQRMTGSVWPTAAVAFLFALHPLHVESVAWISERKDVLSGFFWFLTLWCYIRYVERPRLGRYLLVILVFGLGLMAKPMLVTLPFVLLLLDMWPLRRVALREKAPLFILSIGMSLVTYVVQQRGGAVITLDAIPFASRLGNGLISLVVYIAQMLWPTRLAVFYPYPAEPPAWKITVATLAVVVISVMVVLAIRRRPYLVVGWLWYVGTLVPVIGLIQVGEQSHADRYTYLPLVGLFIMLAWSGADICQHWPRLKPVLAGLAGIACCICASLTWFQIQHWRSSESLFRHAIGVTSGNYLAYTNLGAALRSQGRVDEAVSDFERALEVRPHFVDAENDLGEARLSQGRTDEAIPHFLAALRAKPDFFDAHINLADALDKLGKYNDSAALYRAALQAQPENAAARSGLGMVLAEQGQAEKALQEVREAIRINPDYAGAHYDLGLLLAGQGRTEEAGVQFSEAIRLQPNDAAAHYNLGTAFGAQGRLTEAIDQFTVALRLRPEYVNAHVNLGKAFASLGRFDEAIAQFSSALRIDPSFTEAREDLDEVLALQREARKPPR